MRSAEYGRERGGREPEWMRHAQCAEGRDSGDGNGAQTRATAENRGPSALLPARFPFGRLPVPWTVHCLRSMAYMHLARRLNRTVGLNFITHNSIGRFLTYRT